MNLKRSGEFRIVERIKKIAALGKGEKSGVFVGIGDDAFAGRIAKGKVLVATKDMLVENVHFRLKWSNPQQLGYKAMAVNLSDIAAMGGCRPLYALVGLALTGDITVDFVDKLLIGMKSASKKHKLRILGGDTVSIKNNIVISITLIGEANPADIVKRSGARPGNLIAVSGCFGDSGAGLYLLENGCKTASGYKGNLINRHLYPKPRLDISGRLGASQKLTSMIDSSDGLAASVKFITEASGFGANVYLEKVPVSASLKKLASKDKNVNPVNLALNGGEDYELLFTVKPENLSAIKKIVPGAKVIGEITKDKNVKYYLNGKEYKVKGSGYEHFN